MRRKVLYAAGGVVLLTLVSGVVLYLQGRLNLPWPITRSERLLDASRRGDLSSLEELLREEIDVDAEDRDGRTALLEAVKYSNLSVVARLLESGADPDFVGSGVWSDLPLIVAAREGDRQSVDLLLAHEATVDLERGASTALHESLAEERWEVAELLLERGADPNLGSPFTFDRVVEAGQVGLLRLMVRKGGRVLEGENGTGLRLLKKAVGAGSQEMLAALLGDRTRFAIGDEALNRALFYAFGTDRTALAELLLKSGADIHTRKYDGTTTLMQATEVGNTRLVELALAHGVERPIATEAVTRRVPAPEEPVREAVTGPTHQTSARPAPSYARLAALLLVLVYLALAIILQTTRYADRTADNPLRWVNYALVMAILVGHLAWLVHGHLLAAPSTAGGWGASLASGVGTAMGYMVLVPTLIGYGVTGYLFRGTRVMYYISLLVLTSAPLFWLMVGG